MTSNQLREFYELCQAYRHTPLDQFVQVSERYQALIDFVNARVGEATIQEQNTTHQERKLVSPADERCGVLDSVKRQEAPVMGHLGNQLPSVTGENGASRMVGGEAVIPGSSSERSLPTDKSPCGSRDAVGGEVNSQSSKVLAVGDVVHYYPSSREGSYQVHRVTQLVPEGIPSCREPMVLLSGRSGVVLASHSQLAPSGTQTVSTQTQLMRKLTSALQFCVDTMEHAIELGHIPQGSSTRGMFNDAADGALVAIADVAIASALKQSHVSGCYDNADYQYCVPECPVRQAKGDVAPAVLDKMAEFRKAYDDCGPSQENEGYCPDRGDFKMGFFAAWDLLTATRPVTSEGDE